MKSLPILLALTLTAAGAGVSGLEAGLASGQEAKGEGLGGRVSEPNREKTPSKPPRPHLPEALKTLTNGQLRRWTKLLNDERKVYDDLGEAFSEASWDSHEGRPVHLSLDAVPAGIKDDLEHCFGKPIVRNELSESDFSNLFIICVGRSGEYIRQLIDVYREMLRRTLNRGPQPL